MHDHDRPADAHWRSEIPGTLERRQLELMLCYVAGYCPDAFDRAFENEMRYARAQERRRAAETIQNIDGQIDLW